MPLTVVPQRYTSPKNKMPEGVVRAVSASGKSTASFVISSYRADYFEEQISSTAAGKSKNGNVGATEKKKDSTHVQNL